VRVIARASLSLHPTKLIEVLHGLAMQKDIATLTP
jgi:hypothetical protein